MSRIKTIPDTVAERQAQGIFPVKCAKCGHDFYARRSIAMEMGMNFGGGSCPSCNTYLCLEMFPDLGGYEMVSKDFDSAVRGEEAE